jgi:predicted anti-sigma-YlaC factor YlaD
LNCSQARALLATYREQTNGQADTIALNEHLEACAACRQFLVQQTNIGEHIRALPSLEPTPEVHERLMHALATEHIQYLQQHASSVATVPPPAFLKPYITEQHRKVQPTDIRTTLATADTGPLPVIQHSRRRTHTLPMNHFAILGVAAAILMLIMMGGLTSILLLAHNGLSRVGDTANITGSSINNFVQVSTTNYTTQTPYNHVASAIANRNAIYYTAHGNNNTGWMLEEFDTQTNFSIPLLAHESATPLILLGSNQNWLLWLQLDNLKSVTGKHGAHQARTWTLHALDLHSSQQTMSLATPTTLLQNTFDQKATPDWLNDPIQGIWFTQNKLLVASLDENGSSHLWQFQLEAQSIAVPKQIASANNGHIITSPTANSNDSAVYWSEEWRAKDGVLHSDIWTQQTDPAAPISGKWSNQTTTNTYPLRSDGMSFHPQMVNDTLFFLSTDPAAATDNNAATSTPTATTPPGTATVMPTVTPQATSTATPPVTTTVDPTVLTTTPDTRLQGSLMALTSDMAQATAMDNTGLDSIPQGGSRFVLWQNSTKGMEMYDAVTKSPVVVKDIVQNATFLTVNAETTVWVVPTANAATNAPGINGPTVTFSAFNWPTKTPQVH